MSKKFPFYRQLDTMDCGPSCLRMIIKFYGKSLQLSTIREYCYANRGGVSLLGIKEGAETIGFRTTSIKTSFDRFVEKAIFPCIVHWREEHFCVVYKVNVKKNRNGEWQGRIYVADPGHGLITYSVSEFLDGWISDKIDGKEKGIFMILIPTMEFYSKDLLEGEKKFKLKDFYCYIKPYKKMFLQVMLGMLISLGFSFILPFLTQSTVDIGIMNSNMNFIYMIMVAQLIISLSELFIGFIQSWIILHVSSRISIALISDFITKLLKLPISFFDSKNTGDIIQRIGDHSRIQSFFTSTSIGTLFSFVSFFVFAIILGYYNLYMLLIFIVGHALYVGWILLFLKVRRDIDYKIFDKSSRNQSSIIEIISGAEEIKLCGCEQRMRNKWEAIQSELFNVGIVGLKYGQIQKAGAFFFSNTTNIILSIFSAYLVINGEITLGMMMSLAYIIGQLKGPIGSFIGFVHSYQDAKISLDRLGEIHLRNNELKKEENSVNELISTENDIHINNLSYSYNGANYPPVLKNISLVIPHNKITAIVGESGSGKTTLLKLLLGYYEPLSGDILIGRTRLKNLNINYWRRKCAAVMQNGFIFSTTIAENIAISDEQIDKAKLHYAAKIANIHNFVEQMPSGYNTKIGNEGNGISQGEKQRIQIARAIYKNPEYILFDEATNALDANNEKMIIQNLRNFYVGRTAIIVAHRLSTVKFADQIVVLSNGEIAETGTHNELIAKRGDYYNLVKNQLEL